MNAVDKIFNIIKKNKGYITADDADRAGIARRLLSKLAADGRISKVARGVYVLPQSFEDEMYFGQYRFKKGVFSHSTALYLHSLTDRTPHQFTMTFPFGYNVNSVKKSGIIAKVASEKFYDLGIIKVKTNFGNIVNVYDIEKTLCDILRATSGEDIQIVNQALKRYILSKHKDIGKLMKYAKLLRVAPKVLAYLEALL
ncbi:MAG: type IV toxin-antitoxin system AbiEi family antitoxin domain-containing protein [Endomicrobium sp.]|nr:type IV toxin-antitoxin system AbiEi family antitoxin domain-containing protein [Endomicrobium sp.]